MKLTELNPRWLTPQVFVFDCPACTNGAMLSCKSARMSTRTQFDMFHTFLGEPSAGSVHPCAPSQAWEFSGIDFKTLTVKPSIHVVGHWHKSIVNGEIV